MRSLWFVVPVHGRLRLARICLQQLRRTCDALLAEGIAATAVVVTDRLSLQQLDVDALGFASAERDNTYLSVKFNDGIQLATDPAFNPSPAEFVVPCGSDDWVDHRLFLEPLPEPNTIVGFQTISFVREDGAEIATSFLDYQGGAGIRIIPRELVAPLGYRPADEDRKRGCDTSILRNLRVHHGDALRVEHWHLHPRQIVDWKTPAANLNGYSAVAMSQRVGDVGDPFEELAGIYPDEALEAMRAYYATLASEVAA
jgi:hypothetical protein